MNRTRLEGWAMALLEGGLSNREVMRRTGLHSLTVARIRRSLRHIGVPTKCACGLNGDHRGWCSHRYKNSFARQRFMAAWHNGTLEHCRRNPLDNLYRREQTYRKPGDARRSFYKFICKQELYGNLIKIDDCRGGYYIRERAKMNFGQDFRLGYPSFNAPKSEARRQWEKKFQDRKEEVTTMMLHEGEHRKLAMQRVELAGNKRVNNFFRLMSLPGALNE